MQVYRLNSPQTRQAALRAIQEAPLGYVVRLSENSRSLDQNSRLWASLTDISSQVEWYGKKLTEWEWKDIFTAALKKSKVVPGLDGGFVVLGQHTSTMNKADFSELLELITAFGVEHNVRFALAA